MSTRTTGGPDVTASGSVAADGNPDDSLLTPARLIRVAIAVAGIAAAAAVPFVIQAGAGANVDARADAENLGLWALLPIGLYAVLAIAGMRILPSTLVALAAAVALAPPSFRETGDILSDSVTNQVTIIGLIIALGAGAGEVLRVTGVAQMIVAGILRGAGNRGSGAVAAGIMLACLALVASLGTLAGALAIAAPLLIPVAARSGYTRTATATMMFVGGCAGLALAPFAGSNVAIMEAAGVGYGQYVLYGAGPLAVVTMAVGGLWLPIVQRRSLRRGDDLYSPEEAAEVRSRVTPGTRIATVVFAATLTILVVVAVVTAIGMMFPLIALPLLAAVTAGAARSPWRDTIRAFGRGMASMGGVFVLFWLLALLFVIIDRLSPFDTVAAMLDPEKNAGSAFAFVIVVALVGWVGVPGATAAQVVLLDQVFGPFAAQIGVAASAWVVVLLFASKADTYGPFPNPNMVSTMGLAHSRNLRAMLLTGWVLLVPAALMYLTILFVETR